MEKPKRPLSSFNLFYRYKRSLLVEKGNLPVEIIKSVLTCPAGLEESLLPLSSSTSSSASLSHKKILSTPKTNETRRLKIQTALEGKLLPSTTTKKRPHRKAANGPSITFVELGRLMTESWKSLDPYGKKVFDDLAGQGREIYREALEEYNRQRREAGGADSDGSESSSSSSLEQSRKRKMTKEEAVSVHKVSVDGSYHSKKSADASSSSSEQSGKKDHEVTRSVKQLQHHRYYHDAHTMKTTHVTSSPQSMHQDDVHGAQKPPVRICPMEEAAAAAPIRGGGGGDVISSYSTSDFRMGLDYFDGYTGEHPRFQDDGIDLSLFGVNIRSFFDVSD